jgi:hypothetical protein
LATLAPLACNKTISMLNPYHLNKKSLVLIQSTTEQWEDKTEEISEYIPDPSGGQVTISYRSSPKKYLYRQERVRLLDAIEDLNPIEVQLRIGGRLLSGVDSITKYPGFYLVKASGRRTLYAESNVRVERDVAVDPARKTALDYFRAVADLVSIKNDDGQSLLAGQYKYLTRVPDTCVLAAYLTPSAPLTRQSLPGTLIFPFGTNASQKIAVEAAFQSQVTIVQGPPGTGKTQTILSIVANALCLGQTVAIVSNNNAATKNVADKLERNELGFLLATLGKRTNKNAFIESQPGYPDWLTQASRNHNDVMQLEKRITSLTATLDNLVRMNNERAMLAARITQVQAEAALHHRITDSSLLPDIQDQLMHWSAKDLLSLLIECGETGADTRTGLLNWLVGVFRYGFSGRKVRRQLLAAGPLFLRNLYYDRHTTQLQVQLADVESALAENNFQSIQKQVEEVSWELLRANIAERFQNRVRRSFLEAELWSRYETVLVEYPVLLSTTHSLKTSLSPDCLYDLVIIDEASQVDVATGVLALSCAKRAVIVGDEKQLPNVIQEEDKKLASAIWDKFQLTYPAWNYANNSLLSSAATLWPQAPNILLREHYRCHPKIAGFFNQQFYENQLIIMTSDSGEHDVMQAVFTAPGNHARGRINQRQVDVINQEILPALWQKSLTDIGIISPYRAQVAKLRSDISAGVEVDTVHGFQGREKQAIIMSTVDNEIGDFIDDPKMLNVAVSRAQQCFIVVMAVGQDSFATNFGDLVRYIRHQQQLVSHSHIRSIFDLLYAECEDARHEFLKEHGRSSVWDSENLAEAVIKDVLNNPSFVGMHLNCMRHVPLAWLGLSNNELSERERQFVTNPWSHVDLLIYDTIGKLPLVAVEVDGWAFHRPGSLQSVRDEIKNAIFQRAGLSLVRLSTTGSGEKDIISRALSEAIGMKPQESIPKE